MPCKKHERFSCFRNKIAKTFKHKHLNETNFFIAEPNSDFCVDYHGVICEKDNVRCMITRFNMWPWEKKKLCYEWERICNKVTSLFTCVAVHLLHLTYLSVNPVLSLWRQSGANSFQSCWHKFLSHDHIFKRVNNTLVVFKNTSHHIIQIINSMIL